MKCQSCGKETPPSTGYKPRRYCDATCRMRELCAEGARERNTAAPESEHERNAVEGNERDR